VLCFACYAESANIRTQTTWTLLPVIRTPTPSFSPPSLAPLILSSPHPRNFSCNPFVSPYYAKNRGYMLTRQSSQLWRADNFHSSTGRNAVSAGLGLLHLRLALTSERRAEILPLSRDTMTATNKENLPRSSTAGRAGRARMEEDHLPITLPVLEKMRLEPGQRARRGLRRGWLSRRIARMVPEGRVVGIDISMR